MKQAIRREMIAAGSMINQSMKLIDKKKKREQKTTEVQRQQRNKTFGKLQNKVWDPGGHITELHYREIMVNLNFGSLMQEHLDPASNVMEYSHVMASQGEFHYCVLKFNLLRRSISQIISYYFNKCVYLIDKICYNRWVWAPINRRVYLLESLKLEDYVPIC